MIWFKHYPGDYLTATLRLSMTEDGCYRRLMDEYYSTETPLPLDREELMSVARARNPIEEAAVEKIAKLFFKRESDGYHHKRIDAEIDKARKIAATNRRVAHEREARKNNEPSDESLNEPSDESLNGKGHANATIPEVRSQKSETNSQKQETKEEAEQQGCYRMKLKGGAFFDVTSEKILELRNAYEGIDVDAELRKMIQWCNSNAKKRKTTAGIERFITNWLNDCEPKKGMKRDGFEDNNYENKI